MNGSQYGVNSVKEMLDHHGFKFSKSMGQNFLVDKNIPEKIVRLSGIDETCGVLEVGPGIGALTVELCRAAGYVTAVELDKRLIPILADTLAGLQNVFVRQGDILRIDIKRLVNKSMPGLKYHVCSNLPYNITSQALAAFIDTGIFEKITVMVQREVAKRICAGPGSPDYSAFSVFVNYYMEPVKLFDVAPECFMPRPGVWSTVLSLNSHAARLLEGEAEKTFFTIVRAAFGQRRKTLVNALYSAFGHKMGKGDIAEIVRQCGFDAFVRGETLSIEDFAELSGYFST